MLNSLEITGRARTHVVQYTEPRFAAQPEVALAFQDMQKAAAQDGFRIEPFSSFRDYKTQLRIWNNKFSGKRPLYTQEGIPRERSELSNEQIVRHILDWSGLPGASRHHWGTEIDVIDRAAVTADYTPQLLPQESNPGGVFHPLHVWLNERIGEHGFFRPYKRYQGGMYEEPWHLSYAPASVAAVEVVSIDLLTEVTLEADILGKDIVLALIPEIYETHVMNYVAPDDQ